MAIAEVVADSFKRLIYGPPPGARPAVYILPEHLRSLSKQNVDTEQIITIAETPSFESYGFSLALKSLQSNKVAQRDLLSQVLLQDPSLATVSTVLKDFFTMHKGLAAPISAEKLKKLQFWDPHEFAVKAREVAAEVAEKGEVPILIAYSGLLALPAVLAQLKDGQSLYIVDPNILEDASVGFKVSKSTDTFTIDDASKTELARLKNVALIDDTSHKGVTLMKVSTLFPNSVINKRPFFDLPY